MDLIIKEKWEDKNINKSETIEFDFKTELIKSFNVLIDKVLFGDELVLFEGKPIPESVAHIWTSISRLKRSPLNIITGGLADQYRLNSGHRHYLA